MCEPKAYDYGDRILSQPWLIKHRFLHLGGAKFNLNREARKYLGDKLIVKEINDEEETEAHPS